jgi:KDO2-lipid IV(A) lauroyltransferase
MRHGLSTPEPSTPDERATSPETPRGRRQWYAHRFNSATSLRLILGIIPRVPRMLVPPIAVLTTAICLACMARERRATARNLRRILGARGWRLGVAVWRQFYSFSRFMVSYCDLPRLTPDALRARLGGTAALEARLRDALARGRGAIVLSAHLGNWEIGARVLALCGARVNVVMIPDRASAAERWLMRVRDTGQVRALPVGDSPASSLALRAALARNEVIAVQGDRVVGGRALTVDLFGAPFRVPLGPFLLAYLCDVPLLPAFVVQEGWWRWRGVAGEPIRFPRSADRDADLIAGARQYAACLEESVRAHPDQWFNFYDLWTAEDDR